MDEEFTDKLDNFQFETDQIITKSEEIDSKNSQSMEEVVEDKSTAESDVIIFKEADGTVKNCPICLGPLEVATILDKCFHSFCFVCIYQWTQINPTCPLCKSKFSSIIYNICSESEYQQLFLLDDEMNQQSNLRNRRTIENLWGKTTQSENFVSHFPFSKSHERRKRVYQRQLIPFLPSPKIIEQYKHKFVSKSGASPDSYYFLIENYQNLRNIPTNRIYCNEEEWSKRGMSWVERELQTITEEIDVSILLCIFKSLLKKYQYIANHAELIKEWEGYLFHNNFIFFRDFCLFLTLPFSMVAFDNFIKYCDIHHKIEQKELLKLQNKSSFS